MITKTQNAVFIDFADLKNFAGFKKIIVDAYIDADNNRLVIVTEPENRPGFGAIQPVGEKIMDGNEYNTYRQNQLRKANGRHVDQRLFD